MKILVTIGSMKEKKFTRLFKIIDKLCEERILNGKDIIAQVGYDNYQSKYYKCFNMIPDEEFKKIIDESDLIISHAGTGSVISCLKKDKKVIVFPRLVEYDEHYDNHQTELASIFEKNNYVIKCNNYKELIEAINNINNIVLKKFISNNKKINDLIINFIERN